MGLEGFLGLIGYKFRISWRLLDPSIMIMLFLLWRGMETFDWDWWWVCLHVFFFFVFDPEYCFLALPFVEMFPS